MTGARSRVWSASAPQGADRPPRHHPKARSRRRGRKPRVRPSTPFRPVSHSGTPGHGTHHTQHTLHTPHTPHTPHTSHLTHLTAHTLHTRHTTHTSHTTHATHTFAGPQTPCGLGISASSSRLRNPGSQLSTRLGVAPGWGPGKGAPEGAGGPPGRTSCCLPPGDSGMKRLAHWPAPCTSWTLPHLNFALGTDPLRGTWEPQARTSPPGHSELTVRS